jgi:hypothetical protein
MGTTTRYAAGVMTLLGLAGVLSTATPRRTSLFRGCQCGLMVEDSDPERKIVIPGSARWHWQGGCWASESAAGPPFDGCELPVARPRALR